MPVPAPRRIGLLLAALVGTIVVLAGARPAAPVGATTAAPTAAVAPGGELCAGAARASATVAVVVSFPGKALRTACVAAGGSGIDVLRRAGFAPVTQGYGTVGTIAVCALRDPVDDAQVGCAAGPDCLLCRQPDAWGYFPGYRYSQVGAGLTTPAAGGIEAWVFGRSRSWSGERPTAEETCAPAPPPSTVPPSTVAPTTPPAPTSPSGSGTARPSGDGSDPRDPSDPDAAAPDDRGAPGPSDPGRAEDEEASSTSTTAPPPTTSAGGADPQEPADADRGGDPGDGPDEQAVSAVGTAEVLGEGGGGRGLAPVLTTGAVVGALAALAVVARRRRASADADAVAETSR